MSKKFSHLLLILTVICLFVIATILGAFLQKNYGDSSALLYKSDETGLDAPSPDVATGSAGKRVVIVGDSIAAGWHADSIDGGFAWQVTSDLEDLGYTVSLRAVPGATSGELLSLARGALATADVVLIETGTNDASEEASKQVDWSGQVELFDAVPADAKLFCVGPWKRSIQSSVKVQENCDSHNGSYISVADLGSEKSNLSKDGFHPNQLGHDRLASRVSKVLLANLQN